MAKIIYKEGCEGQNELSCIEGIEIDLLNRQKALIYPKYKECPLITNPEMRETWDAKCLSEIEALKETDSLKATRALCAIGSPAAEFVSKFFSDRHGIYVMPTLLAALEIGYQKTEIDTIATGIKGTDLLCEFTSDVWSSSRGNAVSGWYAVGYGGYASGNILYNSCLAVPLLLYR